MEEYEYLEAEWAGFNSVNPAQMVACSSGTAALHLAFESLNLRSGSEVIMSDFNMIACPRAVAMADLKPAFVDCTKDLLLDTSLIAAAVTNRTTAILATHIYGRRCDMDAIHELAASRGISVIEDMAEIHGVLPHPRTDAACWSFYKNKIVAGEEGGAVMFGNHASSRASVARQLRSLGFTEAHDYMHIPRGHNYRMSNCHARLIRLSFASYLANYNIRRLYEQLITNYLPYKLRNGGRDAPWVYDIKIPSIGNAKSKLLARLQGMGIAARHAFKPMSMQREFCNCRYVIHDERGAMNSYQFSDDVLYLPLSPGSYGAVENMEENIKRMCSVIREYAGI